ncbi:MAG: hypothetical protein AAFO70_02365 [Pseudomonadota bacterium]
MAQESDRREYRWIIVGWGLFVVSALFFVASAWRAGDWLALGGALAFLAANIAFIIALQMDSRWR